MVCARFSGGLELELARVDSGFMAAAGFCAGDWHCMSTYCFGGPLNPSMQTMDMYLK